MKFSLSNIAWDTSENDAVVAIMNAHGITGVDVAPSKLFADPLTATDEDIVAVQSYWDAHGITIAGAQSIHFGFPSLQLFGTPEQRQAFIEHTAAMLRLLGKLGATAVVFGSPKNRVKGTLSFDEAVAVAVPMLRELGDVAAEAETTLVVEPNATHYGCDFVSTAAEGRTLIEAVDHPNIRLHLDTGTMILMQEDLYAAITENADLLHHFHVAEPELAIVSADTTYRTEHQAAARALHDINYTGWVTVEMRDGQTSPNTDAVSAAASFVTATYQ